MCNFMLNKLPSESELTRTDPRPASRAGGANGSGFTGVKSESESDLWIPFTKV